MMSDKLELKTIGLVHSPYRSREEAPPQGKKETAEIEIFDEFKEGLKDIEGFSHIHVFYWLHRSTDRPLIVTTPWDTKAHGVFSTRSPDRPNPIAHSVVELLKVRGRFLKVKGLDAIEGTPVIDLKPYIPKLDSKPDASVGWPKGKFKKSGPQR